MEAEEAGAAQAAADALETREYADASIQFKTPLQTVAAGGALLFLLLPTAAAKYSIFGIYSTIIVVTTTI